MQYTYVYLYRFVLWQKYFGLLPGYPSSSLLSVALCARDCFFRSLLLRLHVLWPFNRSAAINNFAACLRICIICIMQARNKKKSFRTRRNYNNVVCSGRISGIHTFGLFFFVMLFVCVKFAKHLGILWPNAVSEYPKMGIHRLFFLLFFISEIVRQSVSLHFRTYFRILVSWETFAGNINTISSSAILVKRNRPYPL